MSCKYCEEGTFYYEEVDYVTKDMAMDAGDLSLTGTMIRKVKSATCTCCRGSWRHCPNCDEE